MVGAQLSILEVEEGVSQFVCQRTRTLRTLQGVANTDDLPFRAHTLAVCPVQSVHEYVCGILHLDFVVTRHVFEGGDQPRVVTASAVVKRRKVITFRLGLVENVNRTKSDENRLIIASLVVGHLLEDRGQNPQTLVPRLSLDLATKTLPLGRATDAGEIDTVLTSLKGHQHGIVCRVTPETLLEGEPPLEDARRTSLVRHVADLRHDAIDGCKRGLRLLVGSLECHVVSLRIVDVACRLSFRHSPYTIG